MRFSDDKLWRHVGSTSYSDHDALGFINNLSPDSASYLITGSSHVYGTNLRRDETWPVLLQKSGCPIYSAAMGAWSLMQFALVARTMLSPKIERFAVFIYLGFDVYATLRHSLETRDGSIFSYWRESDLKLGINWTAREQRDQLLKELRGKGYDQREALGKAFHMGAEDCYPLELEGEIYWLEPNLRKNTTSLESGYMMRALEMAEKYIQDIALQSRNNGNHVEFFLLPTKEAVAVELKSKAGKMDCLLGSMLDAERTLAKQLKCIFEKYDVACRDLWDFYISKGMRAMYAPIPFEGHPSALGAHNLAMELMPTFPLSK